MKTIVLDISVLNEKDKTGIGVYTYQLVKNLLAVNQKDRFILFGISTLQTFEYLKDIEFKKFPNVEMKIYKMPARFFRRAFLLWQKINWPKIEKFTGGFDIFHSFNWNLPAVENGKIVATVFDMTPLLLPSLHQKKTVQLDKVRLDRIKKYADLVITISENSKKDFLQFAPDKKVEVIYPGVADIFLSKVDKRISKQILAKYGLKPKFLLGVGTLEPRKNIEKVINAFAKLASVNQMWRSQTLVIVGVKGWLNDQLFQLPKELGIGNNVRFIGRVAEEDLPYFYHQALCLIYPSLYEGFGMPILEAQACGCPVITSCISSMPEAAGKGTILVNPNSTEDIIRGILGVGKIRDQLIKTGYENVKRFSWEDSAKKLNLLYQSL